MEVDIPFENMQNNVKRIFNWDWKRGVGLFTWLPKSDLLCLFSRRKSQTKQFQVVFYFRYFHNEAVKQNNNANFASFTIKYNYFM